MTNLDGSYTAMYRYMDLIFLTYLQTSSDEYVRMDSHCVSNNFSPSKNEMIIPERQVCANKYTFPRVQYLDYLRNE